jgi:membrane protease YdiL (CAAX protease family)
VATKRDPFQLLIRLGVYVLLCYITLVAFGGLFSWFDNPLVAGAGASLVVGVFANWLVLRIFEQLHLKDVGLYGGRASADNVAIGLVGGIGSASLVLGPPVLLGASHFVRAPGYDFTIGTAIFVTVLLVCGAIGEELMIHGYAFQLLTTQIGGWATILPLAAIFALLHGSNPASNWISTGITAGFGVVFGYAWLRSRDLWLPIGLHFGWNLTLALFGANISGLRIRLTGYELSWTAGTLWSGGDYGPEASILTLGVLVLLFIFVAKAPVQMQSSPIVDRAENAECEPSPPSSPVLPS